MVPRSDQERAGTSQSLERGLAILSQFSTDRRLIGVSEVANELGLTRSTAHRYIATLARLGYLRRDPASRKYILGPRVLDLGFTAINSMELRDVAAPHLRRLCDETGHTVNMAILDDVDIVYVERLRASRRLQNEIDLDLHVGSRLPAYCTSMGKVLLAFLPDAERDELLSRVTFARRGPNTLTSKDALLAELRRVRAAGIAVNNEELAYGLRSVAVPGARRGRRGRRGGQPRRAPDDGLARRPRRTDRADRCSAPRPRSRPSSATARTEAGLSPAAEPRGVGSSVTGRLQRRLPAAAADEPVVQGRRRRRPRPV